MKYLPLTVLLLATPALAQEAELQSQVDEILAPIAEISSLPDAIHCAALFRSLALSLGDRTEISAGAAEAENFMATTGGMLWFNSEGTEETTPGDVFAVLVPLINNVAMVYLDNMPILLADESNPLQEAFFDQYTYCTAIHDALREEQGG